MNVGHIQTFLPIAYLDMKRGDGEYINNGQTYLYHGDLNYMVTADHFNLSLIMC